MRTLMPLCYALRWKPSLAWRVLCKIYLPLISRRRVVYTTFICHGCTYKKGVIYADESYIHVGGYTSFVNNSADDTAGEKRPKAQHNCPFPAVRKTGRVLHRTPKRSSGGRKL